MKTRYSFILFIVLFNSVTISMAQEKKDDAAERIVKGNTQFAFDLYARLKNTEGNLFFSPYSISTALAMTYAGAKNETALQMGKTLHFWHYPNLETASPVTPQIPFHPAYGRLTDRLNQQGQQGNYQLSIANALWGQKGHPFLDSFIQLNNQYYHAGLENADFINEAEQARQTINQWVEKQTQDKIKDLIPAGTLNAMTRLVLTNAIYFKGCWASQFDPARTEEAPFYKSPEETIPVPLMFQKASFQYGRTETVQILKLPYQGDDLSMVVLLPREKDGLAAMEEQLTADNVRQWMSRTGPVPIRVFLPKFNMTAQFSLAATLAKMGMPDAFSDAADFSGMTGTRELSLTDVLHKAFVEVNEEGTEAAAATGVVVGITAMPRRPAEFRADHPFVFVIKDNNTGSILFLGRVTDPTKEQ